MDLLVWGYAVLGTLVLALGLAAITGILPGKVRQDGLWFLIFGTGALLCGWARYQHQTNSVIGWVGILFIYVPFFVLWARTRSAQKKRTP